jgi:TonB family protein
MDGTKNQNHIQAKRGETAMKTNITPAAYGYQELNQVHQRYMILAMSIAISIQILFIGGYRYNEWSSPKDDVDGKASKKKERTISYIPTPPGFDGVIKYKMPALPSKLSAGIPVPVKELTADTNFATQEQLSRLANEQFDSLIGDISGGKVEISPDLSDPPIDRPPLYEKEPVAVITPLPPYPETPHRLGIEGYAFVKVLVTKEGRVKRAVILKSDCDMFVQPSIDAAMKWVFTPALMNGNPVPVWVAIPFKFRLKN